MKTKKKRKNKMLNEALAIAVKQNFMGQPITEATEKAKQLGMDVRVVQPGMPVPLTNDVKQNRVTFTVSEGKVISFRVG
jgi:hypothetical protein